MSLTPEQRLKQKSFTSYFDVTTEDFTESEEYLKDIADEDVSSTITKLSSLVIKFNDSICKFEKVCESYAGVFSATTKALDKELDKAIGHIVTCNRRISVLQAVLQSLKERHVSTKSPVDQSTPASSMQSQPSSALEEHMMKILTLHEESQKQTAELLKNQSQVNHSPMEDHLKQLIHLHERNQQQTSDLLSSSNKRSPSSVQLPKLTLTKFDGNPLKYREFNDMFVATVHNNERLSEVEKLTYLKDNLRGSAQEAVSGYQITGDNYSVVLGVLEDRFGDKQKAINAHYTALMKIEPASSKTESLRQLHDRLEEHLRSLEAWGQDVKQELFVSVIQSKLNQHTLLQLELKSTTAWTVSSLREALGNYIRARETAETQSASHSAPQVERNLRTTGPPPRLRMAGEALLNNVRQERPPRCSYCQGQHYPDECTVYNTVEARKSRLGDRCLRCLRRGHAAMDCPFKRMCYYCNKPHHRSLCMRKFPSGEPSLSVHAEPFCPTDSALVSASDCVYMQTAVASVSSQSASSDSRLLFDTGASRSYITEDLRRRLSLKPFRQDTVSTASFGNSKRRTQTLDVVNISLTLSDGTHMTLTVNVVPIISSPITKLPIDLAKHPAVAKMALAEPIVDVPKKICIDLLVGSDYYYQIILNDRITFSDGLILLDSRLGLICAGKVSGTPQEDPSLFTSSEPIHDPIEDVKRLWLSEQVGTEEGEVHDADKIAAEMFQESLQMKENRYSVSWPWKDNFTNLPDNFGLAYGRLRSLLHRLEHEPATSQKYARTIQDQLQLGIIEPVDRDSEPDHPIHYLPHHGVIKKGNATTKLRLVYDASAKSSKTTPSLNDCLYKGPSLLPDLCGILARVRLSPIAVCSDIEKAFLQVSLNLEDRDVTRFLWLKDPLLPLSYDNLQTYRFCRVPFGVISSPYLLGATIAHHLSSKVNSEADLILKNTYVDNVIVGQPSAESAQQHYKVAKKWFGEASMNLREFSSNSPAVLKDIPEKDRAVGDNHKVLGLEWNTKKDTLHLADNNLTNRVVRTKREMLQAVASFFDPLGLHSPVSTAAKLLIQEAWSLEIEWDDILPEELLSRWSLLAQDMDIASRVEIPRFCSLNPSQNTSTSYELHAYCDASMKAHGVAVYLRSITSTEVTSHLVFSKSKLAPSKPSRTLTIPRMELLAATMAASIVRYLHAQLPIKLDQTYIWSDSTCVLGWIQSKKTQVPFIERRLATIRSTAAEYRYVPTTENPADLPSRGSSSHDCDLWWHGPSWLQTTGDLPLSSAPASLSPRSPEALESLLKKKGEDGVDSSSVLTSAPLKKKGKDVVLPSPLASAPQQKKKGVDTSPLSLLSVGEDPSENPLGLQVSDFSSLARLVRVTAWAQRFINNCSDDKRENHTYLTASELAKARTVWVKHTQQINFADVFSAITTNKKNQLVNSLALFIDNTGLIRSRGRLEHSSLPEETRFPILLPSKSNLTSLLIREYHQLLMHAGTSHTLASIRSKYWIPRGRSSVKSELRTCITCKRAEGGPFAKPMMAPLPPDRINPADAFQFTGLDYFGPLYVKSEDKSVKVWVTLFTCLVTRAVHLELVTDMSTQQFLLAFRRFVARRGLPQRLVSDNAPQFKLSKTVIDDAWQQMMQDPELSSTISAMGTQWSFIVQHAPWMGGVYERLVGIVKRALRKSIGNRCLSQDQLTTLLCEAEAIVNSRPLVYVGEEIDSGCVITPSHFLSVKCNTVFPAFQNSTCSKNEQDDPDFLSRLSSAALLLQAWKKGQALLDSFWKSWRQDYLLSLRERTNVAANKRSAITAAPKAGDIVLVENEQLPRGTWRLGRVQNVHPSKDGLVRSATVKTTAGTLVKRPVSLLYPLECGEPIELPPQTTPNDEPTDAMPPHRPTRRAAQINRSNIQAMRDASLL